MAAFTSVTAGTAVSGTGALSPSAPTRAVNDLLLCLTGSRNGAENFNGAPAGWTTLFNNDGTGGTLAIDLAIIGRYATNDANDNISSYDFWSGASDAAACILRVQGGGSVALGSLVVGTPGETSGNRTGITCPAATAPEDNCLVLGCARKTKTATTDGATLSTNPTGIGTNALFHYPNGSQAGIMLSYAIQTTAANISAGSWTTSTGESSSESGLVLFLSSGATGSPWYYNLNQT